MKRIIGLTLFLNEYIFPTPLKYYFTIKSACDIINYSYSDWILLSEVHGNGKRVHFTKLGTYSDSAGIFDAAQNHRFH